MYTAQQASKILNKSIKTIYSQARVLGIQKTDAHWILSDDDLQKLSSKTVHSRGRKPNPSAKYHDWRKKYSGGRNRTCDLLVVGQES